MFNVCVCIHSTVSRQKNHSWAQRHFVCLSSPPTASLESLRQGPPEAREGALAMARPCAPRDATGMASDERASVQPRAGSR